VWLDSVKDRLIRYSRKLNLKVAKFADAELPNGGDRTESIGCWCPSQLAGMSTLLPNSDYVTGVHQDISGRSYR
jgi:hypothetical protein